MPVHCATNSITLSELLIIDKRCVCLVPDIVDYFSCACLPGEVTCAYGCYYESVRQPGGQLLNETFGCYVQCDPMFSSTDRCREVIADLLQVALLHCTKKLTCFCSDIPAGYYLDVHTRCTNWLVLSACWDAWYFRVFGVWLKESKDGVVIISFCSLFQSIHWYLVVWRRG